jgi:hypothetical protein
VVKKFSPPKRPTKITTSLRITPAMREAIEVAMTRQGVSLKRRSSWVANACHRLLQHPACDDLILESFYDGEGVVIPLTFDSQLKQTLEAKAQALSGTTQLVDRSTVIRAAITSAVIESSGMQFAKLVPRGDAAPTEATAPERER